MSKAGPAYSVDSHQMNCFILFATGQTSHLFIYDISSDCYFIDSMTAKNWNKNRYKT